ncbi:aquaporin-9a isoform X1 [Chanodichthys erythropterus]|uniref:aquaporin-9a isoform X1 n=1 Tax=Chanodichthys erythropterus TaxID=933992 RepID=UPI00351E138B
MQRVECVQSHQTHTRDHEASLRHQTRRLQRVPGRVPRDLRAGVVRLRVGGTDGVEQKHSGRTADRPHRLQHRTHDGRLRVRRRVGRSPQSGRVSGDGDPGEAEDLEVSHLCDGADARGVRRRGRGVRTVLRCLHGFHQRDPVGDGNQRHRTHLCVVSGETPDRPGRIRGSGGGNGNAGALYPGHRGREEHRRSERRGAAGRGSDPPGHQRVDGAELRIPSEPGARPRPAPLHRRGRMGDGGVQVRNGTATDLERLTHTPRAAALISRTCFLPKSSAKFALYRCFYTDGLMLLRGE